MPSYFWDRIRESILGRCSIRIDLAVDPTSTADNTLILFPIQRHALCCGISALAVFTGTRTTESPPVDLSGPADGLAGMMKQGLSACMDGNADMETAYLDGSGTLETLCRSVAALKGHVPFFSIFSEPGLQKTLETLGKGLAELISREQAALEQHMAHLSTADAAVCAGRLEACRDAAWTLQEEVLKNMGRIRALCPLKDDPWTLDQLSRFKSINAVLNSIDRLEVRGRDSAGISILFSLPAERFQQFMKEIDAMGLGDQFRQRSAHSVLVNNCISIHDAPDVDGTAHTALSFVYKFAAEIGALGDNITYIRNQIRNDLIFQHFTAVPTAGFTVSAHTRWASVGSISQPNCHPVDNAINDSAQDRQAIIHVSLNGDIDNYQALKAAFEARYDTIPGEITTDTKIIPLQIQHYLNRGLSIEEAFRRAVNDFHGSHAVSMHTDQAPGKLFLAQKGSGQALFVGLSDDHFMAASELYGLVEETPNFIKLNGEQKGQIMILDQRNGGGLSGIISMCYDGTPIPITPADIQTSEITSRDIDRQHYPHYFLKEISEAPQSVEKTLLNRWKMDPSSGYLRTVLDDRVIPQAMADRLASGAISRIVFIGQGTAGVAAQGCAELLKHYLPDGTFDIRALKASELSGFAIPCSNTGGKADMADHLVVAISQSGTTTDTNRTVDMVRALGASTLAIVNRRDSDLTFKVDGVLYTSSGRDIEMSVASTKAFYAQITAGALLGLHLAGRLRSLSPSRIADEIRELTGIPRKMADILDCRETIREAAERLSLSRYYWATVGSGANKTAADEIRIKLSELCYKTISSDHVEDKKHIDLSSEPLILVCAAGTRESVLKDIIKDTAIFHAHKAATVVICDEGEERFRPYADALFHVPAVPEHLSPILTTLVGHLWGYYAALSINAGSRFFFDQQQEIRTLIDTYQSQGHDVYEVILEKKFREKIAAFYQAFSRMRRSRQFPATLGIDTASDLTLLSKYLSGRLPVADFEIDFEEKGTPANMLDRFFKAMSCAVNAMARPVDAIKHQAKTVTVGTSRIQETFEGPVFDSLAEHDLRVSGLTGRNVVVIKNLQAVISKINGALLYRISGLTLLGEKTPDTRIEVVRKSGSLENETSRVEKDGRLMGTKNIIVREGNVYIGKGRKDGRSILVIPVISSSPESSAIEYLLSLNVAFKAVSQVPLGRRIKALGGKYTRIKDTVLESSDNLDWDDCLLNPVPMDILFGDSAEKIADRIVQQTPSA